MIGLLTLAAIPTTVAVSEAIAKKDNKKGAGDPLKEAQQMRKFNLRCYCSGSSAGKRDIHNGKVVVGDGKMFIQSSKAKASPRMFPLEAFYVEYPDPERVPQVLGLVTKVRNDPPLLNWIYIDRDTQQVKHANRSGSIEHWVGEFGATDDFEVPGEGEDGDEPSGVVFDGCEKFVAVKPEKGSREEAEGLWEVWWDEDDDKLGNGKKVGGRLVLRVSLERDFIEEEGA